MIIISDEFYDIAQLYGAFFSARDKLFVSRRLCLMLKIMLIDCVLCK